jgi:hypothetical protein
LHLAGCFHGTSLDPENGGSTLLYKTTRRHIPDDTTFHAHYYDEHTSKIDPSSSGEGPLVCFRKHKHKPELLVDSIGF